MQLEELLSRYQHGLKAFLHSRVSDRDDVDDLFQEVMLKTVQNLPTLKSSASLKSWVYTLASNTVIDYYRKHGRQQPADVQLDTVEQQTQQRAAQSKLADCIQVFIKALPQESAELLTQIEIQGRSQKEYAEEKGIKYSTLKSRVSKARGELRKLYENCCFMSLDQQGNIMDYDRKRPKQKNC